MLRLFVTVCFIFAVQLVHAKSCESSEGGEDMTVIVTNPVITVQGTGSSSSSESAEDINNIIPTIVLPGNISPTDQDNPPIDQTNPASTTSNPSPKIGCDSLNNFRCARSHDSLCYCAIPTQMYWRAAYDFCLTNGKHLLSIETPAKSEEIKRNLPYLIGSDDVFERIGFWTSGTLIPKASVFRWASTARYFDWTNWMSGEPTGMKNPQSCVRAVPTAGYKWGDIDCYQLLPFVCQSP